MTPAALEWVTRFRRHLNSERRMSVHTDPAYARDLAALVEYCDRAGITEWSGLDSQHVRRFAAHAHAGGPCAAQHPAPALRGAQFLQLSAA